MTEPCQACDGKGYWTRNRWRNQCPCCHSTGRVPADAPAIRVTLTYLAKARRWYAEAVGPDGTLLRNANYGWAFGALNGVGYHDERPHTTYRDKYPGGYRLEMSSALEMARAASEPARTVAVGVSAGSGVAR